MLYFEANLLLMHVKQNKRIQPYNHYTDLPDEFISVKIRREKILCLFEIRNQNTSLISFNPAFEMLLYNSLLRQTKFTFLPTTKEECCFSIRIDYTPTCHFGCVEI